jgi:energy-coupling factor transport system substrate-specific component
MAFLNFTVKDVVFMALIAVAMNVASFLTVPLVVALPVPGIRNVVVAPFFGLLLAIALLKIKKVGTATIVSFFTGALLVFISPSILLFELASGIVADAMGLLWKGAYSKPVPVVVICAVYMLVNVWFGIIFGALLAVGDFSLGWFVEQPLIVAAASAVSLLLGGAGALVGARVSGEFKKAGVA